MAKTSQEFEAAFGNRLLISEGRRARIMALIFTGMMLLSAVGYWAYRSTGLVLPALIWMSFTFLLAAGYEWGLQWYFHHLAQTGRQPARWRLILNVLVETSLPTFTLLVMLQFLSPFTALTSAVTYLYFLIIMLSALRLDFRLCIFSGVVATLGFAAQVLWHLPELLTSHDMATVQLRMNFAIRCVLFLAAGVAAGLVSRVIRANIQETLRGIEDRQRIVNLFGQHVSPQVVNQLLNQRSSLTGEREVCVLVLDIRKFTTFSENRSADEVVEFLSMLWGSLIRVVDQHGGIVNKFLGDGFLAIFGAPLEGVNNCRSAYEAALGILAEVARLTNEKIIPPTEVGMALHAGQVIAGEIGPLDRKEYTVIGDVVNVAFRIEALNKEIGSHLLMSEHVREHAGLTVGERLEPMPIRGRREAIQLYRLA